jgi:hypothetical protein
VPDLTAQSLLGSTLKSALMPGSGCTLGGQLAFAVPVGDLDYWRASLHREGKRGAVAVEMRNTAVEAANAVLRSYERSASGQ